MDEIDVYRLIDKLSGEKDRYRDWSGRGFMYFFVEMPMFIALAFGAVLVTQILFILFCVVRCYVEVK